MKNRKKKIAFLAMFLFFFFSMFFLFINISSRMYDNAAVMLSIKESKNLQKILLSSIDYESNVPNIEKNLSKIANVIKATNAYPPVYEVKIYSNDQKPIYFWGREVNLAKKNKIDDLGNKSIMFNKTVVPETKHSSYQAVFSLVINNRILGYGEMVFDLTSIENNLFKEKRIIYLLVLILNFFIFFFLIINIFNLQTRVSYLEKENVSVTTIDNITGLYNKSYFFKLMRKEIDRIEQNEGKAALIIADIDNFLDINHKYGYEFGDQVLKTAAKIFKDNFRNFDILGRFEGDELIILMVDSTSDDGMKVAEKCRASVEENKFYYNGDEITITVSIGISSTENLSASKDGIISYFKNLNINTLGALSGAKKSGKNRIVIYGSQPKV
jgi:diguanylate cyclase (GGDEF)-like protein